MQGPIAVDTYQNSISNCLSDSNQVSRLLGFDQPSDISFFRKQHDDKDLCFSLSGGTICALPAGYQLARNINALACGSFTILVIFTDMLCMGVIHPSIHLPCMAVLKLSPN